MQFCAHIPERNAPEVTFTLEDLCTPNPSFTIRELIIPWIRAGNIPAILPRNMGSLRHPLLLNEYLEIRGKHCIISIEPRPQHCDRGHYVAKVDSWDLLSCHIDHQDGWPRYYFDLGNASQEVLQWLKQRNQYTETQFTRRHVGSETPSKGS